MNGLPNRVHHLALLTALTALLIGCGGAPNAGTEGASQVSQASTASADVTAANPPTYFAEQGIAIRGADPVAYFTVSDYVPGLPEFTYDWQGVTWQFASEANRAQFVDNPEAFAPRYGGFCAWAVSQGYTAEIDPTAWKVVEGKLYLNYDQSVQAKWSKDIPGNIAKADQNWPGVLQQ